MNVAGKEKIRQRSDYTHKFNTTKGRHGWLRLTPAYSVKVVEDLILLYDRSCRVLDPFCGTATTLLSASYHGHEGVTTDINPFLVWLGRVKTARYTATTIASTRDTCSRIIHFMKRRASIPIQAPPIHNIERWWDMDALSFLCLLKFSIETATDKNSPERDLLMVAFCRTLIELSNAAFNHQSMSFKRGEKSRSSSDIDMGRLFKDNVWFVTEGAKNNPDITGKVLLGDARYLPKIVSGRFDLVITSPPYANRMSYIRELRPYMYWLGYLENGRDAGEMDWSAIGGTWGIATSRLACWERSGRTFQHPHLDSALAEIARQNNKNGTILANYVAKYMDDMWEHLKSSTAVLNNGAELHYIVGNSTFYGVLLSVEKLYAAMLSDLGFDKVDCIPIRKRNSKKELFEFDVIARWPGNPSFRAPLECGP